MSRSIEEINKIVDIVMTDSDVMDALNDRILAKNLEDLKMARAREDGIEQGKEEGREEGKEEERIEIIKMMIANGISVKQISEILKISVSDIEKIIQK